MQKKGIIYPKKEKIRLILFSSCDEIIIAQNIKKCNMFLKNVKMNTPDSRFEL